LTQWTADTATIWSAALAARDASHLFRGAYTLVSHAAGNWALSQQVALQPNTSYVLGMWMKKVASCTGDFYAEIQNVGGTQVIAAELHQVLASLSSSDWTFKYAIIKTNGFTDSTWRLVMRTDTQAVADFYIDAVQMTAMVPFNGIWFAAISGSIPWALDDQFGFYNTTETGVKLELTVLGVNRTADATSTTSSIIFLGADRTTEFTVGSYIQHPTELTWHKIATSAFSTNTTVTVTPAALTSFATLALHATAEGMIQEFLGRIYKKQLPSASTPTDTDPVM
jgi:hypothetical protein